MALVVLWRLGRETGVMQGPRFVRCAALGSASSWRCASVLATRPCGAMPSGTELRVPTWRHALVLAVRLRDARAFAYVSRASPGAVLSPWPRLSRRSAICWPRLSRRSAIGFRAMRLYGATLLVFWTDWTVMHIRTVWM